jgi:hypothetical protein
MLCARYDVFSAFDQRHRAGSELGVVASRVWLVRPHKNRRQERCSPTKATSQMCRRTETCLCGHPKEMRVVFLSLTLIGVSCTGSIGDGPSGLGSEQGNGRQGKTGIGEGPTGGAPSTGETPGTPVPMSWGGEVLGGCDVDVCVGAGIDVSIGPREAPSPTIPVHDTQTQAVANGSTEFQRPMVTFMRAKCFRGPRDAASPQGHIGSDAR